MKKKTSSGSLQALVRTAEWSVDEAQVQHSEALRLGEMSQQQLDSARESVAASHDRLRKMLGDKILDAGMLQYQHLQMRHHQQCLEVCDKQHTENMQQVERTRQQLLDAKVRAETYIRLGQRREQVARHLYKQQQQRVSDESGVIRAATTRELTSINAGEN